MKSIWHLQYNWEWILAFIIHAPIRGMYEVLFFNVWTKYKFDGEVLSLTILTAATPIKELKQSEEKVAYIHSIDVACYQ